MYKVILALLMCCGLTLFADPITTDQWYGFLWNGTLPVDTTGQVTSSVDATVLDPGTSPWTFSLVSPGVLILVDGFDSGDQFQAFDFGSNLGATSPSTAGMSDCAGGNGPIHCLADSNFSSGFFFLGAGNHSITISTIAGEMNGGAYFGVNPPTEVVPEPSTFSLLAFGGLGLLAWRRKARKA